MDIYTRLSKLRDRILLCKKCTKAVEGTKNFPFKQSFDWIPNELTILFLAHEPPNSNNYFYTNPNSMFTTTVLKLLVRADLLTYGNLDDFVTKGFYLTDIAKCHRGEPAQCSEFLREEIEILNPRIVCTLGKNALNFILKDSIKNFRKTVGSFIDNSLIKEEYQGDRHFFSCYFPLTAPVRNEVRVSHFKNLGAILSADLSTEQN